MFRLVNRRPSPKPKRGFSIVPFFGDLVVLTRLLRDRRAHWGYKAVAILTLLYVICPIDAVPEAFLPIIAWVDDVGVVLAVRLILSRVMDRYRYPLFEDPPGRPSNFDGQFAGG